MAGAQFAQMAFVEQGKARREQFAIDHTFGQAAGNAEADALGQFGQRLIDAALVARFGIAGAVAHDDPIHFAP